MNWLLVPLAIFVVLPLAVHGTRRKNPMYDFFWYDGLGIRDKPSCTFDIIDQSYADEKARKLTKAHLDIAREDARRRGKARTLATVVRERGEFVAARRK